MPAPGPIQPTKTQTIRGLYAEQFLPAGTPKGVVVVTHGYAEHCGRYHELAHVIVEAGWACLTYDVRGHGQSPGERGFIDRFDAYLEDLNAMLEAGKQLAPGSPVILLGHSHGSLITLRALADDHPPECKAAIVTSDKGKQAERLADKLCLDIATARWFTESSRAQDYVAENAARIKVPTTWLVGGADPIADPARSKAVAAKVPGAKYHDLAGLKHEVFNETTRDQVFAEVTRVLASA